ncbi:hypothetical protein ACSMXN_00370 [Jatrophihabitans sp. DSM 45814]
MTAARRRLMSVFNTSPSKFRRRLSAMMSSRTATAVMSAAAADAGIAAPMPAHLYVSECTAAAESVGGKCVIRGVLISAEMKPASATHRCHPPAHRWPRPGQTLTVTIDRTDPHRMHVHWSDLESQPPKPPPKPTTR